MRSTRFAITLTTMIASVGLTALIGCSGTPSAPNQASQPARVKAPRPAIVSAAEWESTPRPFPDEFRHTPSKILLHHAGMNWAAGSDPVKKIKGLQSWGASDKGWSDVPYHFLISPDGRIFEGRSLQYRPDTNTNFDTTGHVNIQLWGNFEEQRVSKAQLESTVALTAWLLDEYAMADDAVATHLDVAPGQTSCPGMDFSQYTDSGLLRRWVEEVRTGSPSTVGLLDPLPNGPKELIQP